VGENINIDFALFNSNLSFWLNKNILIILFTFINYNIYATEFKNFDRADLILSNQVSYDMKLSDIKNSKKNIDIATYIIENDESALKILSELIKKAKSGVRVRILLDLFMNFTHLDILSEAQSAAGENLEIKFIFKQVPQESIGLYILSECILQSSTSDAPGPKSLNFCGSSYQESMVGLKVLLYNYLGINTFAETNREQIESGIMSKDFLYLWSVINTQKNNTQARYDEKVEVSRISQWLLAVIFSSSNIEEIKNPLKKKITQAVVGPISEALKEMSSGFHIKSLNIDGEKVYFGGRNIGDSYSNDELSESSNNRPKDLFADAEARIKFKKNESFTDPYFEKFWSTGIALGLVYKEYFYEEYLKYKINKMSCEKYSKSIQLECKKVRLSQSISEYDNFLKMVRVSNSDRKIIRVVSKNKSGDILKIPSRKMRYSVSDPSERTSANEFQNTFVNIIKNSCHLLIISPYLFPPLEIRRAILDRINIKMCTTKIITGSILGSDFSILGYLGKALLGPIEERVLNSESNATISYWHGKKYLHHKIFSTDTDFYITSSNLDMRSFYYDINNLLQFQLIPVKSSFGLKVKQNIYRHSQFHEINSESISEEQILHKVRHDLRVEIENTRGFQDHLDKLFEYIYAESKKEAATNSSRYESNLDAHFNFL
jgi:phosphatidylserine/phosphatidylglycerophosphate/cardiolipin synthase-like enzyme